MSVRIGIHDFDDVFYDRDADVLYLSKGEPRPATTSRKTSEGHVVRLEGEDVIGVTLINPRWLLAEKGRIVVTLPEAVEPSAEAIEAAMASAS